MKLPNGDHAEVSDEKLYEYLLNEEHKDGAPHAYLFFRLLGINRETGETFRQALLHAAQNAEISQGRPSRFGEKYEIRFPMVGKDRKSYTILSVWMIRKGEQIPRFVTAYVEKPHGTGTKRT